MNNVTISSGIKYVCPLITVSDIKRSRNFYENVLGQKVIMDFGENVTFQGNFAIHAKMHFKKLIDNREIKSGGNNFELYFEYDNIGQIEKKLKGNNVVFVHEVREQPWKQRVIRFYDPDDNIIEIGESMEYVSYRLFIEKYSPEQISALTMMPAEFVKQAIEKFKDNSG